MLADVSTLPKEIFLRNPQALISVFAPVLQSFAIATIGSSSQFSSIIWLHTAFDNRFVSDLIIKISFQENPKPWKLSKRISSVTHLKIFIKFNLSVHVGVDFFENIVKFLAADVRISEALKRQKLRTSQTDSNYHRRTFKALRMSVIET